MALKATVFKVELQLADLDRHYYADHALTLARHPSETDERLMLRLLAFAAQADAALAFGRGLCEADEPALWRKDLSGNVELWIELGQPDERRLLRACGLARQVVVWAYGGGVELWWKQAAERLERARNLTVWQLPPTQTQALAALAERTLQLQCTIQEGQFLFSSARGAVSLEPRCLRAAAGGAW